MLMEKGLSDKELALIDAYWRAANYLSVGQIYLYDNPLLKKPLTKEHIKPRLLGHWGTTPGLNFIYVHLNRLIKKHDLNMLYITGPGHGVPGLVANACVLAQMSHEERDQRFRGYGYTPYFVEGHEPKKMHELMAATLDTIVGEVRRIKTDALRNGFTQRPRWPMIVLRTPKGWTCPKEIDGKRTEDYWRAHQVPTEIGRASE